MLSPNSIQISTLIPDVSPLCKVVLADVSKVVIEHNDAIRMLSSEETHRASSYGCEARRHRYIQCHALLRFLLAQHSGINACDISFCSGRFDKPLLSGKAAHSGLSFNISHSGTLVAIAIANGVDVGVDIERTRQGRNILGIADHFFSAAEGQAIRDLPQREQQDAFYRCWCRKESFIKATGLGLKMPLNCFTVNVHAQACAQLLWVNYQGYKADEWCMHTLVTPAGYAGALTIARH